MLLSEPIRLKPYRPIVWGIAILLFLVLPAFLVLIPNPLTDHLLSRACSQISGFSISLKGVKCAFRPSQKSVYFQITEMDLRRIEIVPGSASGNFIRQHNLEEWLLIKKSRWVLTSENRGSYCLRLLKAEKNGNLLKGGLRFEAGKTSKISAAFWLKPYVWERFPKLIEKRFSSDAEGRRLFKISWSEGLWRLWGRNGPVLEARWQ